MNYYSRAIEILSNTDKEDALKILFKIAAVNPSAICRASIGYEACDLDKQLVDLINGGLFIEAIKLHRQKTNSSLKDAKEYCDSIKSKLL